MHERLRDVGAHVQHGAGGAEEPHQVRVFRGRRRRDKSCEAGRVDVVGEGELLFYGDRDSVERADEGAGCGEVRVELVCAREGFGGEELGGEVCLEGVVSWGVGMERDREGSGGSGLPAGG